MNRDEMAVKLPAMVKLDASFAYTSLFIAGFLPILSQWPEQGRYQLDCFYAGKDGVQRSIEGRCHVSGRDMGQEQMAVDRMFVEMWEFVAQRGLKGYFVHGGGHEDKALEQMRRMKRYLDPQGARIIDGFAPVRYLMAEPPPFPEGAGVKP